MEFKNKIIFIIGVVLGIGCVVVMVFVEVGGIVIVFDINEKGGLEMVVKIKIMGEKVIFIKFNVVRYEEVEKLV